MLNHYKDSWELYKTQSESFNDDFDYYKNLCDGYKTLELFSGYGRLTNFLISHNIDIESVELEPRFAKFIKLPREKNHVIDILKFYTNKQYERIIAGYNSFCLFLDDQKIKLFFDKVDNLLKRDGILSLSYYPLSAWKKSSSQKIRFGNKIMTYTSDFDFSLIDNKIAIWIDEYKIDDVHFEFKYPCRVYKDIGDIINFTKDTNLKLINIIEDYNKNICDSGWLEYVFIKK